MLSSMVNYPYCTTISKEATLSAVINLSGISSVMVLSSLGTEFGSNQGLQSKQTPIKTTKVDIIMIN